jgi:DNA polymerase beta
MKSLALQHPPQEPTDESPEARLQDAVRRKAVKALGLVPGIGYGELVRTSSYPNASRHSATKARELVDAGCRHITDLHHPKHLAMLTPAMKIGLKYYDHLSEPVTREQAETTAVRPSFPSLHRI